MWQAAPDSSRLPVFLQGYLGPHLRLSRSRHQTCLPSRLQIDPLLTQLHRNSHQGGRSSLISFVWPSGLPGRLWPPLPGHLLAHPHFYHREPPTDRPRSGLRSSRRSCSLCFAFAPCHLASLAGLQLRSSLLVHSHRGHALDHPKAAGIGPLGPEIGQLLAVDSADRLPTRGQQRSGRRSRR